jgi:hypothetical protein
MEELPIEDKNRISGDNINPEKVPEPEDTDRDPRELLDLLDKCLHEQGSTLASDPQLFKDLVYLIETSPEDHLELFDNQMRSLEPRKIKSVTFRISEAIVRMNNALKGGLIKDPILKSELEKRLLRLEIYWAAHKPDDPDKK